MAALQGGPVALERAATAPRAKVSGASRSASFGERLARAMSDRSHLCVGIDPHPESLAEWGLTDTPAGVERFGEALVRAAAEGGAAAVKPQSAFFERHGEAGIAVLGRLLASARAEGLLTILDVKRGDIGSTMAAYASAYLDDAAPLAADAVTVSPYLGFGSLTPALDAAASSGRCVFVLALTSNPEGATVQHAAVGPGMGVGESMIEAATAWNTAWLERQAGVGGGAEGEQLGPVGLVIGATIKALPPLGARLIAQFRGPILV
ncbi:MAG: orotidine-5'-phosphate decarboxylase, partial [Bifidobacteriaceae bacterium]|nr:orotidine-5'-phosphate decarboxylase [Bifidobacteriaceae bacterium]